MQVIMEMHLQLSIFDIMMWKYQQLIICTRYVLDLQF